MGFSVRKSVAVGPFRFNFSKGGVGASVGVKGLRIGTGPRGHYVYVGARGVSYRSSMRKGAKRDVLPMPDTPLLDSQSVSWDDDVMMEEIESGDVLRMKPEKFSDLIDEMNAKKSQHRMSLVLPCLTGLFAAFTLFAGASAVIVGGMAIFGAWMLGAWLDSFRRVVVLFYELDEANSGACERLDAAFQSLRHCAKKWHIEASGDVNTLTAWKRNAGASTLLSRKTTEMGLKLPAILRSNVTPPYCNVGRQTLYFFPDVVLFEDGERFGAFQYAELDLNVEETRFIEDESIPSDAKIVDQTWKHPNKKGGPDRRFANNYQIPICLYETIHLKSNSGLNELLQLSRTGVGSAFKESVSQMRKPA